MKDKKGIVKLIGEKAVVYRRLVVLAVFVILSISLVRNMVRISEAKNRLEKTRERLERLERENEELKEKARAVSEFYFVEAQLRDKLGLAKEGEVVVVLPDEDILRSLSPEPAQEEEVLPEAAWERWLKLFL